MTRRDIVQRFAAHFAHLLNSDADTVSIQPFRLFHTLMKTLTGPDDLAADHPYRDMLFGFRQVSARTEPAEAAERYFNDVVDRPMKLARTDHTHKGHALFLNLVQRACSQNLESAALERRKDSANSGDPSSPAMRIIGDRLAALDHGISKGNPAASTREKAGPLELHAGDDRVLVAEEMSIWGAVKCAPPEIHSLNDDEFRVLCSLMIRAVEAADDPYKWILACGLHPFEWLDDLGVNKAKGIGIFINAVRRHADEQELDDWRDLEIWRAVWKKRGVAGFADADALWASEIGHGIRNRQFAQRPMDLEDIDLADEDMEGRILDRAATATMLKAAEEAQVLVPFDRWLLDQINNGERLADLQKQRETRAFLADRDDDLPSYLSALTARIGAFARRFDTLAGEPSR